MATRRVDSRANPLVKRLAALRDRRARDGTGTYLVEGVREVGRALAAGVTAIGLVHSPDLARSTEGAAELLAVAAARGIDIIELSEAAFSKLSLRQGPDGVALHVAAEPRHARSLSQVRLGVDPLILVLDGIEKPGNLGALLRTADAVGVDLVIVTGGGTDLHNPNVIRASQGSVFAVALVLAEDDEALAYLSARGTRLIATTPSSSVPHWAVDLRGAVALLVGSEATGLREEWLRAADELVSIPMRDSAADSLNASVAGAVVLYEALRQRVG